MSAALLALVLAGCDQRPHAYLRPGTSEAETNLIYARCVQEAQLIAFQESTRLFALGPYGTRPVFVPGRGWVMGRVDPYPVNPTFWRFQREQELADYCMRLQGFQWLPLPATGGPGQALPAEPAPGAPPPGIAPPLPTPPPSPPRG